MSKDFVPPKPTQEPHSALGPMHLAGVLEGEQMGMKGEREKTLALLRKELYDTRDKSTSAPFRSARAVLTRLVVRIEDGKHWETDDE